MTPEEHKQRHIELHRALDQLFADYIQHHPDDHNFLDMPLRNLIEWSYGQTLCPDEVPVSSAAGETLSKEK